MHVIDSRAQLHALRRSRARFSVASLLGIIAASSAPFATVEAAPPAANGGPAGGGEQRPAHRDQLGPDHRRPNPLLALLDTDRDGRLSAAEIDAAPAVLRRLDKDGDGQLTERELRPPRPAGAPDMPPHGEDGDLPPAP